MALARFGERKGSGSTISGTDDGVRKPGAMGAINEEGVRPKPAPSPSTRC